MLRKCSLYLYNFTVNFTYLSSLFYTTLKSQTIFQTHFPLYTYCMEANKVCKMYILKLSSWSFCDVILQNLIFLCVPVRVRGLSCDPDSGSGSGWSWEDQPAELLVYQQPGGGCEAHAGLQRHLHQQGRPARGLPGE